MAIFQVTNIISTLEKLPLKNGYIYYIANLDNLSDIMSHGISAISTDPKRSHAEPIYGKAISEYVSLYFNPRNATLYSAQKSYGSKIIILQIHKTALLADGVIFTNASATAARYECANELSDLLNMQFISWSEVMSKGWNHANRSIKQSKRDKMMAEALVPTHLPIDMIAGIICQDSSITKSIASDYNITAVADMEYFFPIKLYTPQSKDELKNLICDEDIYLGDIDTSAITDMSRLFSYSERKDFSGIENWDVSSVTSMNGMFYNCYDFNQPLDSWDVSSVTDMSNMFGSDWGGGCENFNQPLDSWKDKLSQELIDQLPLRCFVERKIVNNKTRYYPKTKDELENLVRAESLNLGDIDTSAITDMSELFAWSERKDFSGIESWDVSNVTDMRNMFAHCYNFNQPLDNWDVSSVIYMWEMFEYCKNFNQPLDSWRDKLSQELINELPLRCFVERKIVNNKTRYYPKTKDELENLVRAESLNLGDIDTSAITDMSRLFSYSERKDFSGIENWDVSNVTDMSEMFRDGTNFNQPLDNWRDKLSQELINELPLRCFVERKIVNNKTRYYPKTKDELENLVRAESLNLGDIDTSAITDMSELFAWSERKDFSGIESWDVSSVTDMSRMFRYCYDFNQPLNNWDVSNVTNMSKMFEECCNFNQPLNNWDVSNVTNMSKMFEECCNFNQPLNNWDVSSVTSMNGMFYNCYDFNQPLNNWDVSSVTSMNGMFEDCKNFNQPLDSWRDKLSQELIDQLPLIYFVERKIVNNKTRYYPKTKDELRSLVVAESLNLGDIDTSAITDMSRLFAWSECKDFSGIENWDVSNATDMSMMFYEAKNFNQPLNNWDVSSVTNMSWMFRGCKNFNQPLNNWDVSNVADMGEMFYGCKINDENKPKFTNMYDLMEKDDDEIPF
ncbi:DarT ssDNA thymidine ADP-ribosyltransferase family protein [Campylobacter devanensis]|uniref:DarT ssDNA thymidine ADP-ribosyltransferase family protein n=1 Tax=Campylobacter devanensis TaxID=3161138 RepID=UPI000A359C37|nr:DarT ssDNA thymidine ADP-ribosyltransferase family protein [Campylobacter sp. P0132]